MNRTQNPWFIAVLASAAAHAGAFWAAGRIHPVDTVLADAPPARETIIFIELPAPAPPPSTDQETPPSAVVVPPPPPPPPKPVEAAPAEPHEAPLERPNKASAREVGAPLPASDLPFEARSAVTRAAMFTAYPNRARPTRAFAAKPRAELGTTGRTSTQASPMPGRTPIRHRNPVLVSNLSSILRKTYPNDARERRIEGHARLELVVSHRGHPTDLRVLTTQGHPAFGETCKRAVAGSRWRPARDASGRRVSMRIRYRCRFSIDD